MQFDSFKLDDRLAQGMRAAGYQQATPIQAAAIPLALEGHDLIGTAQTGTGKTAAFVLPILHHLLSKPRTGNRQTRALIITPTRELADQIFGVVTTLGKQTGVRAATVFGGVGMFPQERALRQGVEIIIACPGRLLDHLQRGNANLSGVEYLVLDEADRMLDMGFLPPIREILKRVPAKRQTLLFSATFDPALQQLIVGNLRTPKRVAVDTVAPAKTVAHALYPVAQHLKTNLLLGLLPSMKADSLLVFTRTKHRADRVAEKINRAGHAAAALHADKSQGQRKLTLDQFRSGRLRILVATDIAARGLDIVSLGHVVNFDVPDSATTYIHRIGRTGRAERSGDALTLVTPEDREAVRDIERILGTAIERKKLAGFNYDEPGMPVQQPAGRPQAGFKFRRNQPSRGFTSAGAPRAFLGGRPN